MRVVVVGASSGLGRCIGVGLGQRGAQVALLARRRERLDGAAAEAGPGAVAIECDVTDQALVGSAIEKAAAALACHSAVRFGDVGGGCRAGRLGGAARGQSGGKQDGGQDGTVGHDDLRGSGTSVWLTHGCAADRVQGAVEARGRFGDLRMLVAARGVLDQPSVTSARRRNCSTSVPHGKRISSSQPASAKAATCSRTVAAEVMALEAITAA